MASRAPQTLGKYQLMAKLATGGMAEIYLARQTGIAGFQKTVVVKRILPHLAQDERFVQMFLDEARIAAQLNHPNIVQITDLCQDGEETFMAMEYLEGESLGFLAGEAMRTGQPIPVDIAVGLVAQVCDGLHYAHSMTDDAGRPLRIVHRDISPHNVIVLFAGGVKLVDFGIAKAASQAHKTRVGTIKGKLTYMAPEQVLGQAMDARTDLFSLGIVLWELCTRHRLFKRDSETAVLRALVEEKIPQARAILPDVPEALDAICTLALQRDPAARFQTAQAFGAALREFLRERGGMAGHTEIAAFATSVFGDRARTKKKLLEQVRAKGAEGLSVEALKPDTAESFPSRSRATLQQETIGSARTAVREDSRPGSTSVGTEVLPSENAGSFSHRWLRAGMLGLILLLACALGTIWLVDSPRPNPRLVDEPLRPPERPQPTEPAPPPTEPAPPPTEPAPPPAEPAPPPAEPAPPPAEPAPASPAAPVPAAATPAPRPHRPSVATQAKPGKLKLNTKPWSDVYLGKRKLGMTPLIDLELPAGVHKLTAINQSRGLKTTFKVTIRSGQTTTLKVDLEKQQ